MQTIHAAAAALRQGSATPVDLVEQSLANVERWEDKVRAWVFVDRDGARAEAQRLTDELRRGQDRGPLHGIPLGVKDIFDVFDWPTAAGSRLWANSIARQDADVVRQLRQCGAIFLGKTVTTQFASFDPPVTRNPWGLDRTPGGSSSGSAAAVATGMCLGALGSQTGGSITRPASYCGVAGYKPRYGVLSLNGIVPLAHSMDHPGPMARCVIDLAILVQAMGGPTGNHLAPDFRQACVDDGPPTLHRPRGLFHDAAEASVRQAMDEVCAALSQRGAVIQDVALPAAFAEVVARHRTVMAVEAAQFHQARFARHPEDYQPRIRQLIEEGLACPAPEYAECKQHQRRLSLEMTACAGILITPATTSPAPDRATTGNPAFNSPWSYTGQATISIPTGQRVDGLPLAIQLVACGRDDDAAELFRAAAWCEQALGAGAMTPPLPG